MYDFKVKLIGCPEDPQTLVAAAALSCFKKDSTEVIMKQLLAMPKEERLKKERVVIENSFGRGHGSVGDQVHFTFSIEDLSRATTLFLCLPEYLEHLQQSLRRASADRGFHIPDSIKRSRLGTETERVFRHTFDFYNKTREAGITAEDARFLLPLYTKTNITTTGNAREICHLISMSKNTEVSSETLEVVKKMKALASNRTPYLFEDLGFNYEPLSWYPSSQLFSSYNLTMVLMLRKLKESFKRHKTPVIMLGSMIPAEEDIGWGIERAVVQRDEAELANLKHIHFEFLTEMSLTCFHQATRQRTWNQSVESIYNALEDAVDDPEERMVVPPSIVRSEFLTEYTRLHSILIKLYDELTKDGVPKGDAVGVVPHSLKIYDWIHINGWNAIHSIGKRACPEAQWEIRRIARDMATKIKIAHPDLADYTEPQCMTYGKCPEIKDCGYPTKKNKNIS